MADITITCGNCGNRITVSEYVEAEFLTCVKCRQKVVIPRRLPDEPLASQMKLAPAGSATPSAAGPPAVSGDPSLSEQVGRNTPAMKRLRRGRRRTGAWNPAVWSGVTFTVVAAALLYLRFYPGAMPDGQRDLLIAGALTALVFLHVSVIAYAFADEAFHGVMCTIIPGYSIYYLFVHADQFLIRAIVGALLIAFGIDAIQAVQRISHNVYVDVSAWIHDTDAFKKDRVPPVK